MKQGKLFWSLLRMTPPNVGNLWIFRISINVKNKKKKRVFFPEEGKCKHLNFLTSIVNAGNMNPIT